MEYRRVGSSGLKVSPLVLGTSPFFEHTTEDEATPVIHEALELGINAIDTGDIYASGHAEELVGQAIKGRRDQVVLMTKFGLRVGDNVDEQTAVFSGDAVDHAERWRRGISPNDMGASRIHIMAAVEASLRRLGTDYIDLYQVHRFDPDTPLEETLRALDDLVSGGQGPIRRMLGLRGLADLPVVVAVGHATVGRRSSARRPFNLLTRAPERELLPACAQAGVGVFAFRSLSGGLLTGRYDQHAGPAAGSYMATRATDMEQFWKPEVFELIGRLAGVAQDHGRTLGELAIAWVIANPAMTGALVGAERPEEIRETAKAADRPLSADELAAIQGALAG